MRKTISPDKNQPRATSSSNGAPIEPARRWVAAPMSPAIARPGGGGNSGGRRSPCSGAAPWQGELLARPLGRRRGSGRDAAVISGGIRGVAGAKARGGRFVCNRLIIAVWVVRCGGVAVPGAAWPASPSYPSPRGVRAGRFVLTFWGSGARAEHLLASLGYATLRTPLTAPLEARHGCIGVLWQDRYNFFIATREMLRASDYSVENLFFSNEHPFAY